MSTQSVCSHVAALCVVASADYVASRLPQLLQDTRTSVRLCAKTRLLSHLRLRPR